MKVNLRSAAIEGPHTPLICFLAFHTNLTKWCVKPRIKWYFLIPWQRNFLEALSSWIFFLELDWNRGSPVPWSSNLDCLATTAPPTALLFSFDYSVEKYIGSTDENEAALWNIEDQWDTTLNWKCLVVDCREGSSKNILNVFVNLTNDKDPP